MVCFPTLPSCGLLRGGNHFERLEERLILEVELDGLGFLCGAREI